MRLLSPTVVDVSSGVENAPGVKDPARVQQFVQAVHGAAEKLR
jgi:phosphoribosylanthranilate isomerase